MDSLAVKDGMKSVKSGKSINIENLDDENQEPSFDENAS